MHQLRTGRQVVALVGLAVLVSLVSAAALLAVAAATGSVWASAAAAAVVAVALCAGFTLWLGRSKRRAGQGRLLTRPLAGPAVLLALTGLVSLTWLWPGVGRVEPDPVPGLIRLARADGTTLALHVSRAGAATQPPLVVVHGGPGVADMAHDVPALARLATDRDVYVYDQIGTGASSRLSDPAGYTTARAVADLEAVRAFTGASRIALLGHSWGALVAISYLSAYPERVAALVLSAPGFLPPGDEPARPGDPLRRLSGGQRTAVYLRLISPRNLFAYGLTAADPQVAHAIAGDAEMDRRFTVLYALTRPALLCDPALSDRLGINGVGYYANQIPQLHPDRPSIDRSRLATLSLPVLIVKPACDYIPWGAVRDYQQLLSQSRLVMLPDAGHQAYIERPRAYAELVHAFLVDQPLPLPVLDGRSIPDGYRGVR